MSVHCKLAISGNTSSKSKYFLFLYVTSKLFISYILYFLLITKPCFLHLQGLYFLQKYNFFIKEALGCDNLFLF